jgi:hypothetical protein
LWDEEEYYLVAKMWGLGSSMQGGVHGEIILLRC